MDFYYNDFVTRGFYRPNCFEVLGVVSPSEFTLLQNKYDKDGDGVDRALQSLRQRTTPEYFRKVYRAQTGALSYSKKVFPTYKFIMPDALSDDWLSTVDWHKKYPTRDHSLHQTLTAYIVANLLGNGNEEKAFALPDGGNLLGFCSEKMLTGHRMKYFRDYAKSMGIDFDDIHPDVLKQWAKDVFYEAAVISALFHDMGYPWEYVNRLAKSIEAAEYSESMNLVCNAFLTKDSIKNRLLIYPFYGYSETIMKHASTQIEKRVVRLMERALRETHGMPGAIGFMCLNDKIQRYRQIPRFKEASYRLILDWAAVGIMMHDMVGLYWDDKDKKTPKNSFLRLSFDLDPLSSIVSMADILEEFYRPYARFKVVSNKKKEKRVELCYDFPCVKTEMYLQGSILQIRYIYKEKKEAALSRKRRKNEVKDYFAPSTGFIDLSTMGITSVECDTEMIKKEDSCLA